MAGTRLLGACGTPRLISLRLAIGLFFYYLSILSIYKNVMRPVAGYLKPVSLVLEPALHFGMIETVFV